MRRTLGALVLALAVAGCGSGSAENPDGGTGGADAITVETARGAVELPATATKVVSLEWTYTEELLALGVEPVGVADSAGYASWVSADGAELPDGVTDVGTRQEPSIEQIRALQPDVIVSDSDRLAANYDQLSDIAPVLAFDPTRQPRTDTMRDNFTELAKAVGKQDEAEQTLAALDAKVDEVTGALADAGQDGATFALAQGYTTEGAPGIRMFTGESLAGALIEATGLSNGWDGKPDEWGMTTVGVEGLTQIDDDATFLYVAQADDDPFTGVLDSNSVWRGLDFTANDRVRALDPGTWLFGGPLSAMQILDETAKAFGA